MNKRATPWDRKYQPMALDYITGHREVREILAAIAQGKGLVGPRAFLLYGPDVTDPTWIADAFVHDCLASAKEPTEPESVPSDLLLQANGASDRGMDFVRERIKRFIHAEPLFSQAVKIVQITGIDSMTWDAQKYLASLLKEGSGGVLFVMTADAMATLHGDILSSSVALSIGLLPDGVLERRLREILQHEGLSLNENVLTEVVQEAGGSLRAAINRLYVVTLPQMEADRIEGREPSTPLETGNRQIEEKALLAGQTKLGKQGLEGDMSLSNWQGVIEKSEERDTISSVKPVATSETRARMVASKKTDVARIPADFRSISLPSSRAIVARVRHVRGGEARVELKVRGQTLSTRAGFVELRREDRTIGALYKGRRRLKIRSINCTRERIVLTLAEENAGSLRAGDYLTVENSDGHAIRMRV